MKKELDIVPIVPQGQHCTQGSYRVFQEIELEERENVEKLMEYQKKWGGKAKLLSILMALSEFDHTDNGNALYALELALSLKKLTNEKLLNLHYVAERNHDMQLTDIPDEVQKRGT
ncbi:hypothetical protein CRYUN_Cryun07bG0089000 [Craigia yunnanensis]